MSINNYGSSLTLRQINKKITTPLDQYKPYFCPLQHTEWTETCPSCRTIYGDQRREYDQ